MHLSTIKQSVIDLIQEKYQIVDIIDLVKYSTNIELLADTLTKYYNSNFSANQRLVVLHHDTDYYPFESTSGNLVYNFLRLCANFLIPLDQVIFLTNHYGIVNEITKISNQICNSTPPKVIYTSQWYDFPDRSDVVDAEINNDPSYLFCCLNHKQRQHRVLTLSILKEYNLLDRGLISYHFGN